MNFPLSDIIFVVNAIKNKSIQQNKEQFVKSVVAIVTYALDKFVSQPPAPKSLDPMVELESLVPADGATMTGETSISMNLVIYLLQIIATLM